MEKTHHSMCVHVYKFSNVLLYIKTGDFFCLLAKM